MDHACSRKTQALNPPPRPLHAPGLSSPILILISNFHFVKTNWKAINFLKKKRLESKNNDSIYNTLTNFSISGSTFYMIMLKVVILKMFLEGSIKASMIPLRKTSGAVCPQSLNKTNWHWGKFYGKCLAIFKYVSHEGVAALDKRRQRHAQRNSLPAWDGQTQGGDQQPGEPSE